MEIFDNDLNAEIIGFFGVVGELNKDEYNYETQTNQIKNRKLFYHYWVF